MNYIRPYQAISGNLDFCDIAVQDSLVPIATCKFVRTTSVNWVAGPDCPGQVPSNFGPPGVPGPDGSAGQCFPFY